MKIRYFFIIDLLLLASVLACAARDPVSPNPAETQNESKKDGDSEISDVLMGDPNSWPVKKFLNSDGSVVFEKAEMTLAEKEYWRRELANRITQLEPIPIDPKYNVQLYKVMRDGLADVAFIAPRVYSYSSSEGGALAAYRRKDGSIYLPFPAILLDGSTERVLSNDGRNLTTVPQSILIHDVESLRKDLAARGYTYLSTLYGCARKVTISAGGESYDATAPELLKANFCEINKPFNVALSLPDEEARNLVEEGLYANAVDLSVSYEVMVPFVTVRAKIQIARSRIYEHLKARVAAKIAWFQADAEIILREIIEKQAITVTIEGDRNRGIDLLVERSINDFFRPFVPEDGTKIGECEKNVCLQFSYEDSKEDRMLTAEWNESSSTLSPKILITTAKLQPVQDKQVKVGDMNGSPDCNKPEGPICRKGIKNDGSSLELGLTVQPGNLLYVRPTHLIKEVREYNQPIVSHHENVVCLRWGCFNRGNPDPAEGCHLDPTRNPPHLQWRCVSGRDEGYDVYTYSSTDPRFEREEDPVSRGQQLFDGLYLKFTWTNNAPGGDGTFNEIECPISAFKRIADGKALLVRLENNPACSPFSEMSFQAPMIHLVNKINYQQQYLRGRKVRYWNGAITEEPSIATYSPKIELGAEISLRTFSFSSSKDSASRLVE